MWNFASKCVAGNIGLNSTPRPAQSTLDCSDDEASSVVSREESLEGLECPICWESFNIVENVPYVLWCGHTLCKNCILGLQWAVVKFPSLPVQLPLFISCPWCNFLSFRFVYRGNLKFPRKNYFLLWMVESKNDNEHKCQNTFCEGNETTWSSDNNLIPGNRLSCSNVNRGHQREPFRTDNDNSMVNMGGIHSSLQKSLIFFVRLMAKFPLVIIFLLIILYVIPASAAILALYILITLLFALPSFLLLYFAYPSLDWLVREIVT